MIRPRCNRLPRHAQTRGFVLIALLVLLTMGGLYFFVGQLTPSVVEALRQKKTEAALAEAKDALIGYALQYRSQPASGDVDAMYGHLPPPDLGDHAFATCTSEGCATTNAAIVTGNSVLIGRFPWKTVGTGPLRDGYGECLWYAISSSHRAVGSTAATMNWDTVAAPDVLYGSGQTTLAAMNAHQRPIAVIFSQGYSGRTTSNDATECGDAGHFVNTTPDYRQHGLSVTGDMIFGTLRKSSGLSPSFSFEINDMLGKMTECARDQIAASNISTNAKAAAPCTTDLNAFGPQGYYRNYADQVFVAKCASCLVTVNNVPPGYVPPPSCAGALLFGNQRNGSQNRRDATEQGDTGNYLEGVNLTSFSPSSGNLYTGDYGLMSTAIQPVGQDIVRCIPIGASLNQVASPVLASLGLPQLTNYDATTRTLTLGATGVNTTQVGTANAQSLFGCSWTPESHGMGSGLRSYFKFNIADTGEGFTFAIIDGDRNSSNVCGAAQQHLGYSGNNTFTASIAYPKIGIEVDTTETTAQKKAFDPTLSNTLTNGRSDPNYTGGHAAIVYWGGESTFATGDSAPCIAPRFDVAGACYLPQEEDDNVHGLPTPPDASPRPSPPNPAASASPATPPSGVYKLDPSLSSIPVNKDIHVRVEISKVSLPSLTSVRVATQSNVSLSNPGASLDGVVMNNGDRVLVMAQSSAADNGIYTWNGAASTMTRTTDANSATTLLTGTVAVAAGTQAGTSWHQTQIVTTLGTDPINWTQFSNQNVAHYLVKSWVLADSTTDANQIAAMRDTSRPMSQSYSAFTPHLLDSPLFYDIQNGACPCGTSQVCGSDNMCYTKVFQNVRLGFTNSQSTAAKDQLINIANFTTTWLP